MPNSKTVFITGASSGIGLATARLFAQKGWNVVATMRNPATETGLALLPNVLILPVDVCHPPSIAEAVDAAIARFGGITVLVNNAGYGIVGAFEAATLAQIRQQYETNVFGLIATTRAVLPHLRAQRKGTVVNVASIGGRMGLPLFSYYNSTKWAVEGISECLQYELRPHNIRVRIIEPGATRTHFFGRSEVRTHHPDYADYEANFLHNFTQMMASQPEDGARTVAATIFRAATAKGWRLRYPTSGGAPMLMWLRRHLPESWFFSVIRSKFEKPRPSSKK